MKPTQPITINHLDVKIAPNINHRLRWKEYKILTLLMKRSPAAVTRAELVEKIWQGTYCADSTINQTIKSIRQKLADEDHVIIKTIPRIGYIIDKNQLVKINFISHPITDSVPSSPDSASMQTPLTQPNMDAAGLESDEFPPLKEDVYEHPIWALPSHSRLRRRPAKKTINAKRLLTTAGFYCIETANLNIKKVIIAIFSLTILISSILYLLTGLKLTLASYPLELAKLNRSTTIISLTCPLDYNSLSGKSSLCEHLAVAINGIDFDCGQLVQKNNH